MMEHQSWPDPEWDSNISVLSQGAYHIYTLLWPCPVADIVKKSRMVRDVLDTV